MQESTLRRLRSVTMLFALSFVAFAPSASAGEIEPFKGDYVGWALNTAVDTNDDGSVALHISWTGRTGPGGAYEAGGVEELQAWDGSSYCSPTAVLISGARGAMAFRYNDGSLLHAQDTSATTLCFDFVDLTWTYHGEFDIVGGTGRFEGASGSFTASGTGQNYGTAVGTFSGELSGLIELP